MAARGGQEAARSAMTRLNRSTRCRFASAEPVRHQTDLSTLPVVLLATVLQGALAHTSLHAAAVSTFDYAALGKARPPHALAAQLTN